MQHTGIKSSETKAWDCAKGQRRVSHVLRIGTSRNGGGEPIGLQHVQCGLLKQCCLLSFIIVCSVQESVVKAFLDKVPKVVVAAVDILHSALRQDSDMLLPATAKQHHDQH